MILQMHTDPIKLFMRLDLQLTAPGQHGHHGVAVVAHVEVAAAPAPDGATRLHRPLEAATAVVLLLTRSPVTV